MTNQTPNAKREGGRRRLIGTVVPSSMAKTAVVRIERTVQHPKYGKTYAVSKKYKVHDPQGKAKPGDTVEMEEIRPISADKRWRYLRTIAEKKQ